MYHLIIVILLLTVTNALGQQLSAEEQLLAAYAQQNALKELSLLKLQQQIFDLVKERDELKTKLQEKSGDK